MLSDWLKTQKKPPKTNQIRAVLTTKFEKMAVVFSKRRFYFVRKTATREKFKMYSKNPNTVKSTSFWLNVLKTRCQENNSVNKIEKNEPEKLKNKLLMTDYAKVKK